MPDIKFVRVERDCPHNSRLRATGQSRGIVYDFDFLIDGVRRGSFHANGAGWRGYVMRNAADGAITDDSSSWRGIEVGSQAGFRVTVLKHLALIPTTAQIEEIYAEQRAKEIRDEAERLALERFSRMCDQVEVMYRLICSEANHLGKAASEIIAAIEIGSKKENI